MKNKILLTESEKERILGLHKNAIKESRLNEQEPLVKYNDTESTFVQQNKAEKLPNSPDTEIETTDSSSVNSKRILSYSYETYGKRGGLTKDDSKVIEYTKNLNNYPECVRKLGKVTKLTKGIKYFPYAIRGEGQFQGFYFYPLPWMWETDGTTGKVIQDPTEYKDYPKVYQKEIGNVQYLCDSANNKIYIGNKKYDLNLPSTRKVPKTEDDLTKDGYYLTRGDRGELVKQIQKLLANSAEGYATMFSQQTKPGKTPFDGIFGQITYSVVREFQKDNSLPQDGKVGKLTWDKLKNTRISFDWDINTREFKGIDSGVQIPTEDKTIVPLTPASGTEAKPATGTEATTPLVTTDDYEK